MRLQVRLIGSPRATSTKTRIKTPTSCGAPLSEDNSPRATSIKTRIKTAILCTFQGIAPTLQEQLPLKQGLRHV